ncbi:post-GPI attachment to proteins factor 2-like isoform X1 [Centruroides sculpturatus]|uniref:post-GPI attachment to proteins factor 2-like isoform X1 n=1 Tax=Centruroides sculpturatus TaxID=218467 RepID=UPI000C6E47C2|nr:post-GPI attachment to proteins factor 2-like isoform X1 [Centruroides sculpturatus]
MDVPIELEQTLFRFSLQKLCIYTVSLPLIAMIFCFATSMLFHFTLVNTTICKVYNFCPSVSAITGVSPQRYIWRICVALHCAPRLLLASVYHKHFVHRVTNVDPGQRAKYDKIVKWNYWFNILEIMSLVGVTYISNRENYPVHEKIFIVFMFASVAYMLGTCIASYKGRPKEMTDMERKSMKVKFFLFAIIIVFSGGMMHFFYKHRVYCVEMAFSWFSLCEYVICFANMAFHATIVWDLKDQEIVIGLPSKKTAVNHIKDHKED